MQPVGKRDTKSQTIGGGVLLATIVIGLAVSLYMMRNNK